MEFSLLEQEIYTFRKEIESNPRESWWIREKYIDLGRSNTPMYCLNFRDNIRNPGDDLLDEPLFASSHQHMNIKLMTRFKHGADKPYWFSIKKDELIGRLYRFLSMYKENYVQPPGNRSISEGIIRPHPRIEGRCFNYQITSPGHMVVGVGPKRCAETFGAISGKVLDESKDPISGIQLELRVEKIVNNNQETLIINRNTNDKGQFWFSKIPLGENVKSLLKVKDKLIEVSILKQESFGKVRGKILDNKANPRVLSIELCSPDNEKFGIQTDYYGQFNSPSLPGFPYNISIQGFGIKVEMLYSGDSLISGIIKNEVGEPLLNSQIVLKSNESIIDTKMTSKSGYFSFENLRSSEYTIEIPENWISLKGSGQIHGNIRDINNNPLVSQIIHLVRISDKKIIDLTRTNISGTFKFFELETGSYIIRIPCYEFIKNEVIK